MFTPLRDILQYYPMTENTDKDVVIRNLAATLVEVTGRWDILCASFVDDTQAGQLEYSFGSDYLKYGMFIEDILEVKVNGICYTRTGDCNSKDYGYVVSEDKMTITLTRSPDCDQKGGLEVKAKMGIDLTEICQLPTYFFRKFAIHIVNYSVYKEESYRRKERTVSSRAYFAQLRDDAEDYFNKNQCTQGVNSSGATIVDPDPIGFCPC